jgi:hypothetical protein
MRHPDVANRDRQRVTLIATANPTAMLGFSASAGVGRDDYPESGFGLQSYDSNQYSIGFDLIPNDRVGFNLVWAWEDYASLTRSRSAVPAPDPQFTDPRRDWLMDYDGTVKNLDATLDVAGIAPRTDVRFNVNWNDATDTYLYVFVPGSVLPPAQQLNPVINELLRGSVDVTYRLTNQVGIGVAYWYEDFNTQDFALGPTTMSDIALPAVQPGLPVSATNSLLLGYMYEPYTAHTGIVKLSYRW